MSKEENELVQPENYQPMIWTAAESGDFESVKYTILKYPQCVNKLDLIISFFYDFSM